MIFDWKEAVQNIISNKKYYDSDRFEKKTEYKQQIYVCTYLIHIGKTKEEIFELWRKIPNEFTKSMSSIYDIRTIFEHLYKQALENVPTLLKYINNKKDIRIYQSEIDEINKLKGGLEFRKYILVLLAIIKYYNSIFGQCELSTSLRSYAFELATGKHYHNFSQSLIKKNTENGNIIRTKIKTSYRNSKPICVSTISFVKNDGNVSIKISKPDEIITFFNRIHYPIAVCSHCGNTYEPNQQAKTNLCQKCYIEYRKNKVRQAVNKSRKKRLTKVLDVL